jgi:hypothetical protein
MRNIYLVLSSVIGISSLMSCSNAPKDEAKNDAVILTQYVDSVANLTPVYTQENWTVIDNDYQARAMKAESKIEALEAEDKAALEASKLKYENLKTTYIVKIKDHEAAALVVKSPDYRQVLRNNLFGEGKIGSDMKFDFVNGKNILSIYKAFVDKVADNKKNYSREDWDEIKVLYEALDTRKNAVEKDLAGSDNMKIAGLKVRFASIFATHRPLSKVSENSGAKE